MKSTLLPLLAPFALISCGSQDEQSNESSEIAPAPSQPIPAEADERLPLESDPVPQALRRQADAAANGMEWHFKPGWALFGPPRSEGALTFHCADGADTLIVARAASQDSAAEGARTLHFRSDSGGATVELTRGDFETGPPVWQGVVEAPELLAAQFAGGDNDIVAALEGEPPLALPADGEVAALIRDCPP